MFRRSRICLATLGVCAAAVPLASAWAAPSTTSGPLTVALYGDSPYGKTAYTPAGQAADDLEYQKSPAFIGTINADPQVSEVVHVGDIHSGKDFCTADYNHKILDLWHSNFTKPLIYTPGDNEWTDCHKATSLSTPNEGGGFYKNGVTNYIGVNGITTDKSQCVDYQCGDPLANLQNVRDQFFSTPGQTLGSGTMQVLSQAQAADPAHPTDAQYVENVMWQQRDTVFVTVNIPGGSNNDADPWYKAPVTQAQTDEATDRTAADIRWLDAAFDIANSQKARDVVIVEQADMWDTDGKDAAHLSNYGSIISDIASNTLKFNRPVLLFNGDSHLYRSDNPMVQGAPCDGEIDAATGESVCLHDPNGDAWVEHKDLNLNVPNFHRVTVHGSTLSLEWLKLCIDPNANYKTTDTTFGPFSWTRMPQPQL